MKRFIVTLMLLILMCSSIAFTAVSLLNDKITVEQSDCYVLNNVSHYALSEKISDNTYKTDISGVSNVINQLIIDGWSITKFENTGETIDAIFEKDSKVYRVYYKNDGTLTFLASPYERSQEIATYINEKKSIMQQRGSD